MVTVERTSRVRWFLVFWLFVLSAVSYLDRVNISIAGGAIVDAYHLTDVQLGRVFSALVAGYAVFQTVGGHLALMQGCAANAGDRKAPDPVDWRGSSELDVGQTRPVIANAQAGP